MIFRILKRNRLKKIHYFVEPDEIFVDSKNLENFNQQQFEGRLERAISKKTILLMGLSFLTIVGVFGIRLGYLQIEQGEAFFKRSENNTLAKLLIFTDRGIIYDRNKQELAWNQKTEKEEFPTRSYIYPGFSHILGYVSYPAKDKSNIYWQAEFEGKDGLEKEYNKKIKGENGLKIVEVDARGYIHSENIVNAPRRGEDLITTIDSRIQSKLFDVIKTTSTDNSFSGGSGVIMDTRNGEIITSTSFPEYSSEILSLGENSGVIEGYFKDKRKIFMDRAISGLYTPGSIVKPFFAIGALAEGVIDPFKKILSTGSISVPNPYFPDQETVFKDWKAHGWTDMTEAIAVSSDVYFYEIGGGFEEQKGMGISNIEKYARLFGIGEKTGVDLPDEKEGTIPSPAWKTKNFTGDPWRVGDTYHTIIGQYGFQVTPLQMARAVSAIANYGNLLTPHFILGDKNKETKTFIPDLQKSYFDVAQEGMREAVSFGTAVALNVPYVEVAAKTGTAQLGAQKNRVNSWVIGFFPYENPKYAFAVMMESGPASGGANATSIMRQLLDWMSINTPEYFEVL
ncbi:MAG: penicillin-binding transpeptidase domain-containing protein [bacterium]|nr:penicillin-binding transpeptidase domain-containing protein [bacterium]